MAVLPKPLIQCEPPSLDWSRPNTPAASDFGDVYFSPDGGIDEARIVFLGGCGLPDGWRGQNLYTIGELGFGTGLNFLTTWQMWDKTQDKSASNTSRLHFISIEKHPLDAAQLQKSLSLWPELAPYAELLIKAWPERVKGFHRLHFGPVTLTLIHEDITPALNGLDAQVDAWFLDGFSPTKNPDMWSAQLMQKLAQLSAPNARLATFTVAASVRRAISEAGFKTERKAGFGRKRNRLEARLLSAAHATDRHALSKAAPIIIGAGISGAALAQAFMRRGITPRIISRGNDTAASGNAAALIKPRLDLQDRPESRFFLSSYLYALRAYTESKAVISRGVTQYLKTDAEYKRFEKLAMQAPLPSTHLEFKTGTVSLPQSLTISPKDIIAEWTQGIDIEMREINDLDILDGPVFAALGHGIKPLLKSRVELRYSRGQISWAQATDKVGHAMSYGGYALPVDGQLLLGATHEKVGDNDPYLINLEDDARNFDQFETRFGFKLNPYKSREIKSHPFQSRASVRVTTPNTLPVILNPKPDQYILTGLGSRGFVFAPLLAEAIVCHWLGEAMPIDKAVWARFGPR